MLQDEALAVHGVAPLQRRAAAALRRLGPPVPARAPDLQGARIATALTMSSNMHCIDAVTAEVLQLLFLIYKPSASVHAMPHRSDLGVSAGLMTA